MDLALIRHPAVAVPPGVCYGHSDVPLAQPLAAETEMLAARLSVLDFRAPVAVYTSPLERCAGVAQALAADFDCPHVADARLKEIDFGAWEMCAWDGIDRAAIDAWALDVEHARPHGGESVAMLVQRVDAWRLDLEQALGTGDAVAVVTHAGVIRVLAARLLDVSLATCLDWQLATGRVCRLHRDPGGRWTLDCWNA